MNLIEIFLLALSLSVDSFAVSMCGSVTLGRISRGKVALVAFVFGLMQTLMLFIGWALGQSVVDYVSRFANVIGFIMLLYIGSSMLFSAIRKGEEEKVDLSGLRNILMAAVATSIDASAAGVSIAMTGAPLWELTATLMSVFAVTFCVSAIGTLSGCSLGRKFGTYAQAAGGVVLIAIGVKLLLG